MTGGVCSAKRSVKECFFFDIDVKGGENNSGALVAINAEGGDCWQMFNR